MSQPYRSTLARKLPAKPNLNQLKKQAKDLLKAFRAGESTAIAEVCAHYRGPIAGPISEAEGLQLSDTQLVLARAYGFDSWAKLKAFVDGVTVAALWLRSRAARSNACAPCSASGGTRPHGHRRQQ